MFDPRYEPPIRAALTDEQLLDALGSGRSDELGTLNAIHVLERETALRNQDRLDFEYWVAQMVAENSEASRIALQNHAPEHLQVEPSQGVQSEPSIDARFEPSADELRQLDEVLFEGTPDTEFELSAIGLEAVTAAEAVPTLVPDSKPKQIASVMAAVGPTLRRLIDFATSNDRALPTSQFWAWFGIAGTTAPILLAALLARLGFSFGQSAAAMALGFIGSAAIVSVGSLAGKRSGLPTLVISRAAFGVVGNMLPTASNLIARLFWIVAAAVFGATLLGGSGSDFEPAEKALVGIGGFDVPWAFVYVFGLIALAALASAWGGRALNSVQKLGGLVGVSLAIALVVAEGPRITKANLNFGEGVSNLEVLTAAILIVACVGLAWASSSADFARKLPASALGIRVVGWALLGLAVVPTAVGIAGAAAFSTVSIADNASLLQIVSLGLPAWATGIVFPGVFVTIVVWVSMAVYSTNLGFQAVGLRLKPAVGAFVLAGLTLVIAGLGYGVWLVGGIWQNLAGLATVFGVPAAAWAGVFIGDVLLRRIAYHEVSLVRSYGFYRAFNWTNLTAFVIACAIGAAMVRTELFGVTFTGLLVIAPAGSLSANLGLFVAGVVGLCAPLLFGLPRIKEQEREVLQTESRRGALADIFDANRELGFDE